MTRPLRAKTQTIVAIGEVLHILVSGPSHRQLKRPYCHCSLSISTRAPPRTYTRSEDSECQICLPLRILVTAFWILVINLRRSPKGTLGDCGTFTVTSSAGCGGPGIGLRSSVSVVTTPGWGGPGVQPCLYALGPSLVSPRLAVGTRRRDSTRFRVWKGTAGAKCSGGRDGARKRRDGIHVDLETLLKATRTRWEKSTIPGRMPHPRHAGFASFSRIS